MGAVQVDFRVGRGASALPVSIRFLKLAPIMETPPWKTVSMKEAKLSTFRP